MPVCSVGEPLHSERGGWHEIAADVTAGDAVRRIFIRSTASSLTEGADPFLALALLPAMRLNAPLRVHGAVSARLMQSLPTFQSIMHTWFGEFALVPVDATPVAGAGVHGTAVGCFFSGGIDSFYSALAHKDEITHLIFVHGMDFSLTNEQVRTSAATGVRQAAAALGKPLIEVETNVRELLDPYAAWNAHAHGTAMAAIALAHGSFSKVYCAAPHSYAQLVPLGLHPLTTPLLSTEQTEIALSGLDKTRWEKFDAIADSPVVQQWLRVCCINPGGAYNCNTCNKCLPTRAYIRAAGIQERFATLAPLTDMREWTDFLLDARHSPILGRMLPHLTHRFPDSDVTRLVVETLKSPPAPGADRETQLEYQLWQEKLLSGSLDKMITRLRQNNATLVDQLKRIHASRSMRLTAPLRAAQAGLRKLGKRFC